MAGVQDFIGSWREEAKEGYDEMAEALGLPPDKKEFFKSAKTEISYQQNGDEWEIHVGMQGVPNHRTFRFKLGEPYVSADLDGSPMKSIMAAEGNKFVEHHTDENIQGKEMKVVRWVDGGKMIVETSVGPLQMKSIYGRI